MTRSKDTAWIAGAGVLALLVLAATYFLLIAPKRTEAADIADQTAAVAQSNAAIEQKTAQLKSQFTTLGDKEAEVAAIRATMPADAQVPALLRQLQSYADSAGLTLTNVAPGTPSAFGAKDGAVPGTGGTTVVDVPLTVTTSGSFTQTELFLKNVQADMGRYFLVDNVSLQAGDAQTAGTVTGTITGDVFVLRDGATQNQSTASGDAAGTGTSTATTDASPSTETVSS
ncbi:type 4a pilus biogenesis protein PilO [Kineococcus sp. LSe6-4]|uniref:Type 4a pilus biogenesis protein PilO n=1 Tax=Kineococcus halophytocola TaxID=3234027 RepID=A0ABV4GWL7_9ACTN